MRKEYLILAALILVLGAYIFLRKENKEIYTLPEIPKIAPYKIEGFSITRKGSYINFIKEKDKWYLTDKKYPADPSDIQNILNIIQNLKISALVSEKEDLKRYDLDDEKYIKLTVSGKSKTLLEFYIGKTAPTFNHTFILLKNNKNIYHANENFRDYFDKTIDDFRDKKVMEFEADSIGKIILKKQGGISKILISEEKEEKLTWTYEDGSSPDQETFSNFLSSVSFLECKKFLDSPPKKDLKNFIYGISFENDKKVSLNLLEKKKAVWGTSSMSDYAFVLSEPDGKEMISYIEKLISIKKKK